VVQVGLSVDRGLEMVEAMLGILKSGGVCLPLDPGYPPDRLPFKLADSGAPRTPTTPSRPTTS